MQDNELEKSHVLCQWLLCVCHSHIYLSDQSTAHTDQPHYFSWKEQTTVSKQAYLMAIVGKMHCHAFGTSFSLNLYKSKVNFTEFYRYLNFRQFVQESCKWT